MLGVVQRIDEKLSWEDLRLDRAKVRLLHSIAAHAHEGGSVNESSLTCFFSGSSGTGKTIAAQVLAAHLDLPLFRIDLGAVVSKYIGETEKNLNAIFAVAAQGSSVLFFDEADALFGKRTDVKDAHDRYANAAAQLIGGVAAHCGLRVFAVANRESVTDALSRTVRFVVEFA